MRYWNEHPEELHRILASGGNPHETFSGIEIRVTLKRLAAEPRAEQQPEDLLKETE